MKVPARGDIAVRLSRATGRRVAIVLAVPGAQLSLLEFPADDPERARRFWAALLGGPLEPRHDRGGLANTLSDLAGWAPCAGPRPRRLVFLPYFAVDDLARALEQVEALGGSVIHPGSASAVCKDSEGSPLG